jgi:hypothetical protein
MTTITENLLALQANTANTAQQSNTVTIERILERSAAANNDRSNSSTKKSKFDDLPPNVKLCLKRMCAVNIFDEEPDAPSQGCLDIMVSGNKAQQTNFVNSLHKSKRVQGRWSTGHISRFIYVGPLWVEHDDPAGLTMLGIHCAGRSDLGSTKSLQLAVQHNMDNKLDKADVELLTKKEYYLPKSAQELRTIFTTYEAILGAICTPEAILPQVLQGWINHLDTWFAAFTAIPLRSEADCFMPLTYRSRCS